MKTVRSIQTTILAVALLAVLISTQSCATKPAATKKQTYTFFPAPPDPPRLQFLVSFSSEEELRGGTDSFAQFVTGEKLAKNPILKPYGIALHNNQLYVCDTALHAVLVLDLVKKKMHGIAPHGEGQIKEPVNISVDADGTIYITDTRRDQVLMFDGQENFLGYIGEKDEMNPRDVVITKDRLYIGDSKNHSVRVYDKAKHNLLFVMPKGAEAESVSTRLAQPTNLAIDPKGNVYIGDTGGFRVQKYSADGKYICSFGENGDAPGQFKLPKGIAIDRDSRLYTVDAANQVIQMFDEQGRLLMWFGDPTSSDAGLDLPAKVIIDYDHVGLFQKYAAPGFKIEYLVVVSNQFGARKVSFYGFGSKK